MPPDIGADGATTPETLRQKDRCKILKTLKSGPRLAPMV